MLNQIDTNGFILATGISISSGAAEAVRRILAERNLEGYALRVYVSGSSCRGVQFGMALDKNIQSNDKVFTLNNVQVVVDEMSMPYLEGANIDFVEDPTHGAGFVVSSPNAQKEGGSCSCGSGGGHEHEDHEGDSCGCGGGSCGCGD